MKILLTNDDGYSAQGIIALFEELSPSHTVFMIAPTVERSACSNAITMRDSVDIIQLSDSIFSLSGYPADCVNVGIYAGIIPDIDLVISGINHGPNMGDDVYYSGTVAGARTAFINGKPGIAVSLCGELSKLRFSECASYVHDFINSTGKELIKHPVLLNINYPDTAIDACKGSSFTFLDKRHYVDHYDVLKCDSEKKTIKLDGIVTSEKRIGSDFEIVSRGYVSITPLLLDSTDYSTVTIMNESLCNNNAAVK
jgi:5'-nucleotidase